MFNFVKSYWPTIKFFILDLLKFKKKDILFKLLGVFLWLYIIRIIITIVLLVLFILF